MVHIKTVNKFSFLESLTNIMEGIAFKLKITVE